MPLRLNLEYLKTFMTVVRCGGICKAAQQLHLTQPAVTTRIRNLEESLSTSLFDRVNAGLKLTKKGEMLLSYSEQFLNLVELVERDVIDPEGLKGQIRLGVSETIAQSWLPEYIYHLNSEYPSLEIEIIVDISSSLRKRLIDREIDLAFLLGPISEFSIDNINLSKFDLAWYSSKQNDFEETDLLKRPIATFSKSTKPYRELKSLLHENIGPEVKIFPSSSLSACFKLLEKGLCVAALPKILAEEYIEKGTIMRFDPGWVPNPLCFTASYLGNSKSHLIERAAIMASEISNEYSQKISISKKTKLCLV